MKAKQLKRLGLGLAAALIQAVSLPAMAGEIHGQQTGQSVSLGNGSLARNTSGKYNTAVGHRALHLNATGQKNTAVGRTALRYNTRGNYNTGIGSSALKSNTIGYSNTGIGSNALENPEIANTLHVHFISRRTGGRESTRSRVFWSPQEPEKLCKLDLR